LWFNAFEAVEKLKRSAERCKARRVWGIHWPIERVIEIVNDSGLRSSGQRQIGEKQKNGQGTPDGGAPCPVARMLI